jgi:hypothetical protein
MAVLRTWVVMGIGEWWWMSFLWTWVVVDGIPLDLGGDGCESVRKIINTGKADHPTSS